MSRMIDLVRASGLPSHQMMSASKGALRLPAGEMVEILVHIAQHNRIFGETARLTLAGWDEVSAKQIVSDPSTPSEVLDYWVSPKNIRPGLLPLLLENPSLSVSKLSELAANSKGELADALISSPRIQKLPLVLRDLSTNHHLSGAQAARVESLIGGDAVTECASHTEPENPSAGTWDVVVEKKDRPSEPASAGTEIREQASANQVAPVLQPEPTSENADPETETAVVAFFTEHAKEIAAAPEKPFQPIGGMYDELAREDAPQVAPAQSIAVAAGAPATVSAVAATSSGAVAAPARSPIIKPAKPGDDRRDSTLQRISKLDIKGRIQMAMKGTKEERSVLIRDGTKLVALAVLESPKISDGEVEKFATQKNVLEAVLRAIPMKRRFAKNYAVVRGLVSNPRTPLDVALGLMKNLLIADLKNLSGNKEVPETVRKLALRMFKQKQEAANKS
jgi:hypothetical protein